MILIKATYKETSSIVSLTNATVGTHKVESCIDDYVFDGTKLYKLTYHDGTNGFYKEIAPAIGTMVQYTESSTVKYKTWKAGTPSWQLS